MLKTKHTSQEGRTIIETLAYIMIMITITAGIAAIVSRGYYKYESSAIQQDLVDLHKAITKHYAIDGQYSRVNWNDLCEDNLGPKSMMPTRICQGTGDDEKCFCKNKNNPRGRHIFDGDVLIGKGDCEDNYCATFYIEFRNLPRDICAQLAAKSWTTTAGSDLERLIVNQTLWYWEYAPPPVESFGGHRKLLLPVELKDVASACKDGYYNTIRWYFN